MREKAGNTIFVHVIEKLGIVSSTTSSGLVMVKNRKQIFKSIGLCFSSRLKSNIDFFSTRGRYDTKNWQQLATEEWGEKYLPEHKVYTRILVPEALAYCLITVSLIQHHPSRVITSAHQGEKGKVIFLLR